MTKVRMSYAYLRERFVDPVDEAIVHNLHYEPALAGRPQPQLESRVVERQREGLSWQRRPRKVHLAVHPCVHAAERRRHLQLVRGGHLRRAAAGVQLGVGRKAVRTLERQAVAVWKRNQNLMLSR